MTVELVKECGVEVAVPRKTEGFTAIVDFRLPIADCRSGIPAAFRPAEGKPFSRGCAESGALTATAKRQGCRFYNTHNKLCLRPQNKR